MIVHESARRGQLVYGQTATEEAPPRKRDTGTRTANHDDKGRPTMPFDEFVVEGGPSLGKVLESLELAFGGR